MVVDFTKRNSAIYAMQSVQRGFGVLLAVRRLLTTRANAQRWTGGKGETAYRKHPLRSNALAAKMRPADHLAHALRSLSAYFHASAKRPGGGTGS